MRTAALTTALASAGGRSSWAAAAAVEAGSLTTVTAEAPLHDSRLSAAGGCDPGGCIAHLTRDGDMVTADSRWSCKPSLGPTGSTCSITYSLADSLDIIGLNVAMYKGDSRTRTMDVFVDDVKSTSWTSSGLTTAPENIELGVNGKTVELRGVLEDSEWLSIMEVEILADDGVDDASIVVEASTVTSVTTSALLYDERDAVDGGCDPNGCAASNTQDGEMADMSRWSCAPKLGDGEATACSISYTFGTALEISELRLALYKGTERQVTVQVHVDGDHAITWTSSGTTDGFESIGLTGAAGTVIDIVGVLADSEWLSIIEAEIIVLSDDASPPPTPPPATEQEFSVEEIGTIGAVTVTADLFDTNSADDDGCDPSGCRADLTRDGDLTENSRWSCAPKLGGTSSSDCTISYDLGEEYGIEELRLALYKGSTRVRKVEVRIDGALTTTWTSSGTTDGFENIDLSGTSGRVIDVTGQLADSEWLSITEAEIMVLSDGSTVPSTPAPTPPPLATRPPVVTPTPPPATPPPVTVEPPTPPPVDTVTGELKTVGLVPRATVTSRSSEVTRDIFYLKDGDMSTSWTCTGDPPVGDATNYDCRPAFDLFSYRRVREVKIALANGASGPIDMSISTNSYYADISPDEQVFVTSSGLTDGFETYDFSFYTNHVTAAAVFSSPGQSISIAEVEVVEEVFDGEVHVQGFGASGVSAPDGYGWLQGTTANSFEWPSDSTTERTFSLDLSHYAFVTALEMRFPVGDTYKFDIWLRDEDGKRLQAFSGLESADIEGWQSFDTSSASQHVTVVELVLLGTGSGAPAFKVLDVRVIGTVADNPTDTFYVGSANLEVWGSPRYPDFVAEGTGDQKAIMGAICAVKKASFDGVDCVGVDDTATGTVKMNFGEWFVDGNIFMKSSVNLVGRYTQDDWPYTTELILEEGAAGKTDIAALVVMDDIINARVSSLWVNGLYDPESSNADAAASGLGSVGVSIIGSNNITLIDTEVNFVDGDAVVIRDSKIVYVDAGPYDEQYTPWEIGQSRGTGIVVDSCLFVFVRRYAVYDNGIAGIHIMGSSNVIFNATVADRCYADNCVLEGDGRVGSLDGQQPIEVIVESSAWVQFNDMKVLSPNDPVMTIAGSSDVSFNNCGFSNVASGTCVIEMTDSNAVSTGDDPELTLEDSCYLKV